MKKFLAILLAAMLVLSMTAVAFADDATKTFNKVYNLGTNVDANTAFSPAEEFSFTKVAFVSASDTGVDYPAGWAGENDNLPTINSVTYSKGEAGGTNKTKAFTVTLPTYPSVGIFTYSFSEVNNNVAGVTYNDTAMYLVVTVEQGADGKTRVAAIHCEGMQEDGSFATGSNKMGEFVNTYSAGALNVTKTVSGNMGDKSKEFEITVTFKAPTGTKVMSDITYNDHSTYDEENKVYVPSTIVAGTEGWTEKSVKILVKDGETVTFTNIPVGVTYEVVETDAAAQNQKDDDDNVIADSAEYKATYANATGTIDVDGETASVTNTKNGEVDTGITVDSLPYVLLMGIVLLAGAAMIIKRRAHNN